ncbi:MAG: hypothetical protein Q8M93_11195 [Polaromonas sp.]|nr:hypothetical protein [Polaromonas sp.]MDP1953745.1 hypothetical protein [Polaromonas sp.]MDP3247520.1 hypothetical protein [Polaromonas sp.]MDP3753753.1 hypothetical protein [Polaromonas sp.]
MNPIHLHRIATESMRSRGPLSAFSPAALHEAEAARRTAPERNGDTRDLDQLSVAEPLAVGAARLLVALADVDCGVRSGGAAVHLTSTQVSDSTWRAQRCR